MSGFLFAVGERVITNARGFPPVIVTVTHREITEKARYTNDPYTVHRNQKAYQVTPSPDPENRMWAEGALKKIPPENQTNDETFQSMLDKLGRGQPVVTDKPVVDHA